MTDEKWLPIDGYKYYEVSNLGRIRSISHQTLNPYRFREGRILAQAEVPNGYMHVSLTQEGKKKKSASVHRLVAKAFVANPDNKKYVNHKNGDKKDNRAENLEWCTASENSKHAYRVLKVKPGKYFGPSKHRKFTDDQVVSIRADKRSNPVIAREYNVDSSTIWAIKNLKTYKQPSGAEVHDFAVAGAPNR